MTHNGCRPRSCDYIFSWLVKHFNSESSSACNYCITIHYTEYFVSMELFSSTNFISSTVIYMVNLYHRLSRSIHLGDLHLFIHSLSQVTSYFFAFNFPNYARWAVMFHDNLLKLQDSHPTIFGEFCKGMFSLRRTSKSFSRTPIDLVFKQTINDDTARQKTSLQYITNSIAA